jgi:alpha-L-arabinofuranosidase
MGTNLLEVINDVEEIPVTVSYNKEEQYIIVKLVNYLEHEVRVDLETKFSLAEDGEMYIMEGKTKDVNSIYKPFNVAPKKYDINVKNSMSYEINPRSFCVIKMYCKDVE